MKEQLTKSLQEELNSRSRISGIIFPAFATNAALALAAPFLYKPDPEVYTRVLQVSHDPIMTALAVHSFEADFGFWSLMVTTVIGVSLAAINDRRMKVIESQLQFSN